MVSEIKKVNSKLNLILKYRPDKHFFLNLDVVTAKLVLANLQDIKDFIKFVETGVEKERHKGMITDVNIQRYFGFILDDLTKNRVFFHFGSCNDFIQKGDFVEYEIKKSSKGLEARNIKIIGR